jgi:hypothetical protein
VYLPHDLVCLFVTGSDSLEIDFDFDSDSGP